MNRELASQRPREWLIFGEVVLAIVFGVLTFAILFMATGGALISLAIGAVVLVIFGLLHYVFWGQSLLKNVARECEKAEAQTRQDRDAAKPEDEFTLALNEHERLELIQALESLTETSVAVEVFPRPVAQKVTIQGVLEKLRGFGA